MKAIRKKERLEEWENFQEVMKDHLENYAQIQYGNPEGDEQIDRFSAEDCWQNIQRYYNRRNSSVRGESETRRDAIKVSHYAQVIYNKLLEELEDE